MEQITDSLSLIVGPLLAAPLLFGFGLGWALLIDTLSFVLSFCTIAAIRTPIFTSIVQVNQKRSIKSEFLQRWLLAGFS